MKNYKNKTFVISDDLTVWLADNITHHLMDNDGRLSTDIKLSESAQTFLSQFTTPVSFDSIPDGLKDESLFMQAIKAKLLIAPETSRQNSKYENLYDGFRFKDFKASIVNDISKYITRKEEIDNREIVVIDNFFSQNRICSIARWMTRLNYYLADYDTEETPEILHWIREFKNPNEIVQKVPFLYDLIAIVRQLFPQYHFDLKRLHANSGLYGDLQLPHKDVDDELGFTLLYFGNKQWNLKWMGETVFYQGEEPVYTIIPKPGRIAIFDGNILHRAGVPSRLCMESRKTLSLKFLASEGIK